MGTPVVVQRNIIVGARIVGADPLMVVIGPECTTPARGGTGKTKQGKFMNASKRSGERLIRGHAGHVADCDRLSALQWPQKSKSMLEGQIEGRKSVRPKSRTSLR